MVKSKKIICLIFSIVMVFAVCALCAPGVAAADYTPFRFRFGSGNQSIGSSLPLNATFTSSTIRYICSFVNEFNSTMAKDIVYYCTIQFVIPYDISLSVSSSDPYYLKMDFPSASISDFGYSRSPSGNSYLYFCTFSFTPVQNFSNLNFTIVAPSGSYGGSGSYVSFSLTDVEPEPEPDPSTVYTPVDTGVYFSNSKRSDLSVWNYNNTVSSSLPLREYVNQSQPWDYYCGCLIENWSDIFRPNTVLQGEVQLGAVDLTVISDVPDSTFSNCNAYFVSSTEPSAAVFQYQAVPSTWESEIYSYRTTLNNYGYAYIISFYIVIPDTYLNDLNFTPVDLCFLFGNFHPADGGKYAVVLSKLDFNYYFYGSSPDAVIPDNPDNGIPDSVVQPTPINEVSEQTQWLTQQYYAGDDQYDGLISSLSESTSNLNFELYGRSLDRLSQLMNSTSMNFDFKLPAAYIPAISDKVPRLDLWDNTNTIPFKFYVDQLPVQYKKIIGFIVLFSASSAIIGSYGLFFRRLLRKDVST